VEEMPEMAKQWLFPWDELTSHQSYNVTVRWKQEEEVLGVQLEEVGVKSDIVWLKRNK